MRELIKRLSPELIRKLYRKLRATVIRREFTVFGHLPIRKKRVVLCNVWGYGDNTKWIARALRFMDKSLEVIYVTDKSKVGVVPAGIKFVSNNSPLAIYYLATAHIWVDCNRKEPYITKRPGQFYIQTWHGSLPLKRIEGDCEDSLPDGYMLNAERDSAMTDLYLSNGDFMSDIYRKAFRYSGEIAVTGSARLDPVLKPNFRRVLKTRQLLGINDKAAKIAVYAPTYRDRSSSFRPGGDMDFDALIESLEKRFGGTFYIITRLHPLEGALHTIRYGERVINGNIFGDLYELLEASDVLITDYSNTMFEFSYTGKPVFLYAPDVEEYARDRGFYFDYSELAFPHASSEDELRSCIEAYDSRQYIERLNRFYADLGVREDGKACARIANIILRKVYE